LRILHIVGARPNFMKVAPVVRSLNRIDAIDQVLIHTGQHYDDNMSNVFFQELGMKQPDVNLQVGSGSHAVQTAQIMMKLEGIVTEHRPDLVLVYGDVNSTVAASLVCSKLNIAIGHVEAGLRSNDRSMPEEINRIVTDQLSDILFTPSIDANENLLHEGVESDRIFLVGNVMIDTLVRLLPQTEQRGIISDLSLTPKHYGLVTLHRPSNVDDLGGLKELMLTLLQISNHVPIVFPVHPRTRKQLATLGLQRSTASLRLLEPLSYLDFLSLQRYAMMVITDSGGVQEETTYLGVPCLTMRDSTERPITIDIGSNILIGSDTSVLLKECQYILNGKVKMNKIPLLWDGEASGRIANIIRDTFLRTT